MSQKPSSPPKTRPTRGERRRRWFGGIVIVLLLAALAFGAYRFGPDLRADANDGNGPDGRPNDSAPAVIATTVRARTFADTVRGIGTLRSPSVVHIAPESEGILRQIHFREGAVVEAGETLFTFDHRKLQHRLDSRRASLRSAEARADNAQITFDRVQQLRRDNVATADEYDRARSELNAVQAEVEQWRADVALAEEELADTVLKAPFEGVIAERLVDAGNYVQIGERLATIYRIDPLEMSFRLPERYRGRILPGQHVEILVAAYPDERFEGRIEYVGPAISESTRDFLVKANVNNEESRLRPGFFGTARVVIDERAERPSVPEEALVSTRRGYTVFVIDDDNTVDMVPVEIGLRSNGHVELREGPDPGTRVVRQGQLRISPGRSVTVTDDEDEVDDEPPGGAMTRDHPPETGDAPGGDA